MFPPPLKHETSHSYSKEEEMVNDALMAHLTIPREMLGSYQAAGFTPRRGYEKREPGIFEVLGTARDGAPDRRMDYSGSLGNYSGTSRPGFG